MKKIIVLLSLVLIMCAGCNSDETDQQSETTKGPYEKNGLTIMKNEAGEEYTIITQCGKKKKFMTLGMKQLEDTARDLDGSNDMCF